MYNRDNKISVLEHEAYTDHMLSNVLCMVHDLQYYTE